MKQFVLSTLCLGHSFFQCRTDLCRWITFYFIFFLRMKAALGKKPTATVIGRVNSLEKVKPNTNKPTFLSSLHYNTEIKRLEITILIIYATMDSQGIYNVSDTCQLQSALRKGARAGKVDRKTNSRWMKPNQQSLCSKKLNRVKRSVLQSSWIKSNLVIRVCRYVTL